MKGCWDTIRPAPKPDNRPDAQLPSIFAAPQKVYVLKKDCPNIGKEIGDYYNGEYAESIEELIKKGVIEEEVIEEEAAPKAPTPPSDKENGVNAIIEEFKKTFDIDNTGDFAYEDAESFLRTALDKHGKAEYERGKDEGFMRENLEIVKSGFSQLERETITRQARSQALEEAIAVVEKIERISHPEDWNGAFIESNNYPGGFNEARDKLLKALRKLNHPEA